jgi:hypothetical protein
LYTVNGAPSTVTFKIAVGVEGRARGSFSAIIVLGRKVSTNTMAILIVSSFLGFIIKTPSTSTDANATVLLTQSHAVSHTPLCRRGCASAMSNIVDCDVGFLLTVSLPALPRNRVQVAAMEKPLNLFVTARYRQTASCAS